MLATTVVLLLLIAGHDAMDLSSFLGPPVGRTYVYTLKGTVGNTVGGDGEDQSEIVVRSEATATPGELRVLEIPIISGLSLPSDYVARLPWYRLAVVGSEMLRIDEDGSRSILMRSPVELTDDAWPRTLKVAAADGKRTDVGGLCRFVAIDMETVVAQIRSTVVTTRCSFVREGKESITVTERYGAGVGTVMRRLEFHEKGLLVDWTETTLVGVR